MFNSFLFIVLMKEIHKENSMLVFFLTVQHFFPKTISP
jgi:hypothetical protein